MAAFSNVKQDPSIADGFFTYMIAAAVAAFSLGSAVIIDKNVFRKKAKEFKKSAEVTIPAIKNIIVHSFGSNELKDIHVHKLGDILKNEDYIKLGNYDDAYIEISLLYNGDGVFVKHDNETLLFDTVNSLANILKALFENPNVAYLKFSYIFDIDKELTAGISLEAARIKFYDKLKNLSAAAIIDPYGNFFDLCEAYHIAPFAIKKKE